MTSATKTTIRTFGAVAGLAGIEHGIGEIRQGNIAPDGMLILSWPESELFRIVAGEPAMTIVPNLLVTGILAVLVSLIFLIWVTLFVHRPRGGLVLLLLSAILLLLGGGFGPPLLGIILSITWIKHDSPSTWWPGLPAGARRFLGGLWPWSLSAGFIAWLLLLPGSVLIDHFVGVNNPDLLMSILIFSAFGLLLLTIFTGFAYDSQQQFSLHQPAAVRIWNDSAQGEVKGE